MKLAVFEWNCQVEEANHNHTVEPCDFLLQQKARREEDFEWLALLVDKQMASELPNFPWSKYRRQLDLH